MRVSAKWWLCLCVVFCAVLSTRAADPGREPAFAIEGNHLHLRLSETTIATYLMKSNLIRRPGFINVRTTKGTVVTRPFPVKEDPKNGGDHPDMHPGLWFGFGDLNGTDFWRNKGTVEQVKFTKVPSIKNGTLGFGVLNRYLSPEGVEVCQQTMEVEIRPHARGWRMTLATELWNAAGELSLGAQEEMGLGVRMADGQNEKAGGMVTRSLGDLGAKVAWGKVADWWDYSGPGGKVGVLVVPSPANALKSWGHTRDYGVMVVNPTPRDPPKARITIPRGQTLKLKYEVLIHETDTAFKPDAEAAQLMK